jgi:hypothetical protein
MFSHHIRILKLAIPIQLLSTQVPSCSAKSHGHEHITSLAIHNPQLQALIK